MQATIYAPSPMKAQASKVKSLHFDKSARVPFLDLLAGLGDEANSLLETIKLSLFSRPCPLLFLYPGHGNPGCPLS